MIELITNKIEPIQPKTLRMCDMKPLQVCVVVKGSHKDELVMRTQSNRNFELMNLSYPNPGDG